MTKKRRRISAELFDNIARLLILLGLIAYAPIVAWWKNIPPAGRTFMIIMATIAVIAGIGAVVSFSIYRKRERANAWKQAMRDWKNTTQSKMVAQKQSAIYMSDVELERFAAQIYKKMGYKVQHVGSMSDHGVDVMMLNPNNQKEIVQCKQWNKPVGEPVVRDLFGVMMHEGAVRDWLWAPRGFSEPAKVWAKGKAIELVNDKKISYLVGLAFGSRK